MNGVRIYQPDKTAMQSGRAKTHSWRMVFPPNSPYYVEPLMGWSGMHDMTRELKLHFPTQEAAVAYAQANGIPFEVVLPKARKIKPKAYADNFRFDRNEAL